MLLSFIYATPVELGLDPGITEFTPAKGGPQSFIYMANDDKGRKRFFQTSHSLSERRPLCNSGRATRVWKVHEVMSPVEPVRVGCKEIVLKDIWLEQGAETERDLQNALFTDIEAFERARGDERIRQLESSGPTLEGNIRGILANQKYKKHFLTILFDRLGPASKKCPESATPNPNIFNPPLNQLVPPRSRATDHSRASSSSPLYEQTSINAKPARMRTFVPKCRYIIVFEEVCESVEELTSFSDAMSAVVDTLKGYIAFFSASFLH